MISTRNEDRSCGCGYGSRHRPRRSFGADDRNNFWPPAALLALCLIVTADAQWPAPGLQSFQPALRPSLHAPTLKTKSYDGYLPETAERGAMVRVRPMADAEPLQILVHDEDLKPGMSPAMYQYVVTGHGAEKFGVNERGYLYLNAEGGALPPADYRLDVRAREVGTTPAHESATIRLTVHLGASEAQTNANAPVFARPLYLANVTAYGGERTALQVKATDADGGQPIGYHIVSVSDSATRLFRYDTPSHELRVLGPLTAGHTYQVILEAVDAGGLADRTTVFVYAHPNKQSNSYRTSQEQQQLQSLQQPLLLSEQQQPMAGRSADAIVSAETYQRYLTEMMAHLMRGSDLSQQQTQQTQQPQQLYYTQQQQQLPYPPQQQQSGQTAAPVLYYQQQPPNYSLEQQQHTQQQLLSLSGASSLQQLQSSEGSPGNVAFPQLSPAQLAIPAQQQKQHSILPTAAAIGQFNRRLNGYGSGAGESDFVSRQEAITIELSEATPPNSIVTVLGDASSRSRLYYWIADEDRDDHFGIDPDSGTISTVRPLDRELNAYHTLKVQTRSRNPDQLLYWTLINVTVTDENDNAPEFSDSIPAILDLRVDERVDQPADLPIGKITVHDADAGSNGGVKLTILPPKDRLFTIDEQGTLTVRGTLTASHFGEHAVMVAATDGGVPPLETRAGLLVRIRTTHDASSGASDESLQKPMAAAFALASLPPAATPLFTRLDIAAATATPYLNAGQSAAAAFGLLTWTPTDEPTTSTVLPTAAAIRYLSPVFQTPAITLAVEENDEEVELCRLEARYPEALPETLKSRAAFIYVIEPAEGADETKGSEFELDSSTGRLTLVRPLDADGSAKRIRTLRVGTRLVDSATAGNFTRSDALPHSATVTVQVLDVNDYIPNFEQDVYRFRVSASAPTDTVVGQVTAYDNDADAPNNKISYRILNADGLESFFSIEMANGTLRVADHLDELAGERLTLRLIAIDGGEPSQNATAEVIIQIEGPPPSTTTTSKTTTVRTTVAATTRQTMTTDNSGSDEATEKKGRKFSTNLRASNKSDTSSVRFSARNYFATIMESRRGDGAIPTVIARLPLRFDAGSDARYLMCALAGGNRHGTFDVTPSARRDACELRAVSPLDREASADSAVYRLNVTVALGAGVEDSAIVVIRIADANDNAPRFIVETTGGYGAALDVDAPTGTRVLTVQAEDADEGPNGVVHYDINGTDALLFSIDTANGTIATRQQISDNSDKTQFHFWTIACDSPADANRTLCTKARVRIDLVGRESRFATVFSAGTTESFWKHATEIGTLLSQFTGACATVRLESVENRYQTKSDIEAQQLRANWYALAGDGTTQRVCRTAEYGRLFTESARDTFATKLAHRWGLRLATILNQKPVNSETSSRLAEKLAAIFAPFFNVHTGNGLLMYALLAASLLTLTAGCIFCACRSRGETRAAHRRRRVGAMSTVRRAYAANGGVGYPIPKYSQNSWHSVYLPTLTTPAGDTTAGLAATGGAFGAGPLDFGSLERDKYYESQLQMLELPATDSDLMMFHNNMNNNHNKRFGSPSSVWSKSATSGNNAFYNPTTGSTLPPAAGVAAMLSGRGAAARTAQKFAVVPSTAAEDSASGEFSADDDQPLAATGYYATGETTGDRPTHAPHQKISRYSAHPKHAF